MDDRGERKGVYMYVSWNLAGLLRGNLEVCSIRGTLVHIHVNTNCPYGKGGAGGNNTGKPLVPSDMK
eukprot:13283877-Ditylum_brightwellii.AAC.1